jgi:hypothetical protein
MDTISEDGRSPGRVVNVLLPEHEPWAPMVQQELAQHAEHRWLRTRNIYFKKSAKVNLVYCETKRQTTLIMADIISENLFSNNSIFIQSSLGYS